jgi:hypothetical protein
MARYKAADGLKYIMERLWEDYNQEFPPSKGNLIEQYYIFEEHMNKEVHPKANEGAAESGDGILTDHGPEHIQMVIRYAYELIKGSYDFLLKKNYDEYDNDFQQRLRGYEIYILLLSIHFHDVGIIFGRNEHEKRIDEVMQELGDLIPLDNAERRMVFDIASAHGGFIGSDKKDKDTLKPLLSYDKYGRLPVRQTLIASILRFADELSDDRTRANRFVKSSGQNGKYHEYSKSLFPIEFKHNTIAFEYDIPYNLLIEKVNSPQGEIYLYDEILNRLIKCMCELEYCRKYSDGFIIITALYITINILKQHQQTRCEKTFKFELRLSGYPDINIQNIKTYLDRPDDFRFDCGESLKSSIIAPEKTEEGVLNV